MKRGHDGWRMAGALLAVALMALALPARADDKPAGPPKGMPQKPPGAEADKPDFPKFEEVCKEFEAVKPADGSDCCFINLWYNKKTDQLFAQVPAALIGKKFLIASSVSGGPFATGFQIDHFLAYIERMDKQLVLMRVDPRFAADEGQPVADVVKRSHTDEIVRQIGIRTMKGGDPVIDLGEWFKGDFGGLGGMLRAAVNPGLSKWARWKTFGENTEIAVDMAMMGRGPAEPGGTRMRMHYSLSALPTSNYKPRASDDRVGYFLTVRYDWAKKYDATTLFNRYINRWNLQKREPDLEMSPPVKPIRWFIEKTVPVRWRRYVAEGILEWNKAYEKCGFVNAVEVLQQENDNEYARLDPEDVRYNFFRWIVTGNAFAMGPSRDHPLTGEIFDADIVFDDSMVRAYARSYNQLTGTPTSWEMTNPFISDFFRAHPEWAFQPRWAKLMPRVTRQDLEQEAFYARLSDFMARRGRPLCDYASGKAEQLAMAGVALEAKGATAAQKEEFLGQVIKEIVMHEVGHCLGLRHNFKASSWRPLDEITASTAAGDPTVGSVMDYNPAVVMKRGEKPCSFAPRTIGPYDYWAIEYGYKVPGKEDKGEDEMLKKIAARGAEAGLDYATDEDTFGVLSPDPWVNRYDLGKDPTAFAEHTISLVENLLKDITSWCAKDGESYTRLRPTVRRLLFEKGRQCMFVARFVGGQSINRDHKGDPNARPSIAIVDTEKQRQSRDYVIKHVFAADAFQFDPELLSRMSAGRYWHWNSDEFDFDVEFNVHDLVAANQYQCLFTLMNPFTITRIYDAELKVSSGQEPYTLADHITTLTSAIWSELDGGKPEKGKAYINSFRRNLQRMDLGMLLNLVLSGEESYFPPDAGAVARMAVAGLSEKIGKVLDSGDLDTASRAHLLDSKKRIDRALEAQYLVGMGHGGSDDMFFGRPAAGSGQPGDEAVEILPRR
ncbi:MAG: zinc-dependent metalloprotease [Phycisphaerae bacterium]